MPDKMNLKYPKLLYCEFQKYDVKTMSVAGGRPKKPAYPSYKTTKHIERTFLISDSNTTSLACYRLIAVL